MFFYIKIDIGKLMYTSNKINRELRVLINKLKVIKDKLKLKLKN